MEVIVMPDERRATQLTAKLIADAVRAKPNLTLGLATGRTMENLYALLGKMHKEEGLDFSLCRTFNLDEYVGLPGSDPNSYRAYMNHHLFSRINIDMRNTHLPHGDAADLKAECAEYEQLMLDEGGVDLQLLGIGRSGHIGFNEPLSPLTSRTRAIPLTPVTIAQNSPLFANPADMPKRGLSMGVGTILESKRIVMLVTGAEKADIIAKAIEGPVTSMISASALQMHNNAVVILDESAAAKLQGREYYDWIFQNEPHWAPYR